MKATFILSGKVNDYEISGWVEYYVDKHYGEDVDGNRGSEKTFINDYDIESIMNVEKKIELIKRIPRETMIKIYDWFTENL